MMGSKKTKVPKEIPAEFKDVPMVVAFTGFVADHPETGEPLAIAPGETFHPIHALVRMFASYCFADATTPSWDLAQLRVKRERGHV